MWEAAATDCLSCACYSYNAALVKQYGASAASTVWSSQTYNRTPMPFTLVMQTVRYYLVLLEGCGFNTASAPARDR